MASARMLFGNAVSGLSRMLSPRILLAGAARDVSRMLSRRILLAGAARVPRGLTTASIMDSVDRDGTLDRAAAGPSCACA